MLKIMKITCPLLFLLYILSGCNVLESPTTLIKPPKLEEDQSILVNAVQAVLPSGAKLLSPVEKGDSSPYSLIDLDQDDIDEAVVFYYDLKTYELIGLVFIEVKGTWRLDQTISGFGIELYDLQFADVTGDHNLEIIAGYANGVLEKGLNIYHWQKGNIQPLFDTAYSKFIVDDLNQDGLNELTVLLVNRGVSAEVTSYLYKQNGFIALDQMLLDEFGSYENVISGFVTNDKKGLVLDIQVGAHAAYTEVLLLEQNQLQKASEEMENITWKEYPVNSEDVDMDGIIEIGKLIPPVGFEDESYASTPYITSYYQWYVKDGLELKVQRFYEYQKGFYFEFPMKWNDLLTIENSNENEFSFITIDEGKLVFNVISVPVEEWEPEENTYELGRNHEYVFITTVNNAELRTYFHLQ
ncbi:hypothetical protein [Chengkuizengella axinellae]|uniref:VCBS repeat-containing protein n=1 Tax=Chengkuizengella axinellae TaxID=3064388 RepID=A0ABT9J470_9BACL|nr:hypothetical protein [Chengkuizengella sp. 2205SS18-9]MDP5276394.1 hypothetical protein [Chengkuizengella sp. 2205SS18-9]